KAWENGTTDVRQDLLLTEVDCDSASLAELFQKNDAWGSLIVPGERKGTFRLCSSQPAGHEQSGNADGEAIVTHAPNPQPSESPPSPAPSISRTGARRSRPAASAPGTLRGCPSR